MIFTLKDIYIRYKAEGGTLNKTDFKNICCDYNIHSMNHIIYQAGQIRLPTLSTLEVVKVKRKAKNKDRLHAIDWPASNAYKQELLDAGEQLYDHETGEGKKWLVYRTDPYYVRFYWQKYKLPIVNKSFYSFIATRGKKGNKEKLKSFLNEHETNINLYKNARIYKK